MDDRAGGNAEPEAITAARSRAGTAERVPSAGVGGLLAWVAATTGARNAVEVGSAGGVSGLWLMEGFGARGTLTSVEPDPHRHSLASQAFEESGQEDRIRTILGEPDTVLERLTDRGYDLVLLQSGPPPSPAQLGHASRLLRSGGALVVRAGSAADAEAVAEEVLAGGGFHAVAVLPLDGGLVLATRAPQDER